MSCRMKGMCVCVCGDQKSVNNLVKLNVYLHGYGCLYSTFRKPVCVWCVYMCVCICVCVCVVYVVCVCVCVYNMLIVSVLSAGKDG